MPVLCVVFCASAQRGLPDFCPEGKDNDALDMFFRDSEGASDLSFDIVKDLRMQNALAEVAYKSEETAAGRIWQFAVSMPVSRPFWNRKGDIQPDPNNDQLAIFNRYLLDNKLIINGKEILYEDSNNTLHKIEYLGNVSHIVQFTPVAEARDNFAEVIVPHGHYLVLGDNRNNSADSRYYGFVPAIEIQGKASKVLLSLDPKNYYLPRKERFNEPLI